MLCALPIIDLKTLPRKIEMVYAKTKQFEQSETGTIGELRHQPARASQVIRHRGDFALRQHCGHFSPRLGSLKRNLTQLTLQRFLEEKHQRIKGLLLRTLAG